MGMAIPSTLRSINLRVVRQLLAALQQALQAQLAGQHRTMVTQCRAIRLALKLAMNIEV